MIPPATLHIDHLLFADSATMFPVPMDAMLPILIAEDNEDDVYILQYALKKAGLTNPVQICCDGLEVIRYLRAEGVYANRDEFPFPRLLVLDLKMPGLTGFEVLRWRRDHPDCSVIPCIVLSTSRETSDIVQSYELGANAYFTKPGDIDELANLFRRVDQFWSASELPPLPEKCA